MKFSLITRQYETQSIVCCLLLRLVTLVHNLASHNQTYLYAAAWQAKRQRHRERRSSGAGWKVRKATTSPDSDRSFTLAVLESQSFMYKITLGIIQAAISHIVQFSDIVLLFRKPLSFQSWPNQVQHQACLVMPSFHYSKYSWKTKHQAPISTTFSVTSWEGW